MQNSRNKTHKRRGTRDIDAEASSKSFISKVGYTEGSIELERYKPYREYREYWEYREYREYWENHLICVSGFDHREFYIT